MAGQDGIPDILLDTGLTAKNLGKLSLEEYYEFARTVDVALSLMLAPHPSYPPLEFASIGAAVVTTEYIFKTDLSSYSKNIIVTKASQSAITTSLIAATTLTYDERIQNATACSIQYEWNVALADIMKSIIKII
jgi:hypothetical protein